MKTVDVKTIRRHIRQCRAEIADAKRMWRTDVKETKQALIGQARDLELDYAARIYSSSISQLRAKIDALEDLLKEAV